MLLFQGGTKKAAAAYNLVVGKGGLGSGRHSKNESKLIAEAHRAAASSHRAASEAARASGDHTKARSYASVASAHEKLATKWSKTASGKATDSSHHLYGAREDAAAGVGKGGPGSGVKGHHTDATKPDNVDSAIHAHLTSRGYTSGLTTGAYKHPNGMGVLVQGRKYDVYSTKNTSWSGYQGSGLASLRRRIP